MYNEAKCGKSKRFQNIWKKADILKNCSKVLTYANESGNAARGDTEDPPVDTPEVTAPRAARRLRDGRGGPRAPAPRLGAEQQLG